jgi:mono/diheme cytochrome c family protein
MNSIRPLFLILALGISAYASLDAEKLIKTNCASCHILTVPTPEMIQTLKAPAMEAVVFHLKDAMNHDDNRAKAFIIDFTQNPNVSKSVCESNKVAKFGVMPSLKGKVSPEDLATIAEYMLKTYPTKKFVKMITKMLANGKLNSLKNSPFLMNQDALPHVTKILIENWDKESLGLSKEQKENLLIVRKETMSGIKKIKKSLRVLEESIIEMSIDSADLKKIEPKVNEVAKLKAQATMIQLKCLKDSIKILNDKQIEMILPFWDL